MDFIRCIPFTLLIVFWNMTLASHPLGYVSCTCGTPIVPPPPAFSALQEQCGDGAWVSCTVLARCVCLMLGTERGIVCLSLRCGIPPSPSIHPSPVRFKSSAATVGVRYRLLSPIIDMWHMPSTGMSGADLYVFDAGNATWRWVGTCKVISAGQGQPLPYVASAFSFPHADRPAGFDGEVRYKLHLPTYNGMSSHLLARWFHQLICLELAMRGHI